MRSPKLIAVVGALIFFGVGVLVGSFVSQKQTVTCASRYSFLNTSVVCGKSDVISKTGYEETRQRVNDFVESEQKAGRIDEFALYFRDLEHGPVFGINEISDFAPASLLKLPLAIVYMSFAENQPELLTKKLQYTGTTTVDLQRIKPQQTIKPNEPHTIEELLGIMLAYSDNASYELLNQYLTESSYRNNLRLEVFKEIGIIDPKDRIETTVSVRGYASILRILYNVSYLNADLSEKTLSWLAESDFSEGLKAGVPKDIAVAHKFGERAVEGQESKQLHDCGIVYYPDNPYLLCIMTRGDNFTELESIISAVSRMVYEEVDSRRL